MSIRTFISICALVFAPFSNAVILYGDFTGTLTSSYDKANTFGHGAGWDTLVGESIAGTFSIDTDLMPSDSQTADNYSHYQQIGSYDWFTFNLTTSFGDSKSSADFNNLVEDFPILQRQYDEALIQNDLGTSSLDDFRLRSYASGFQPSNSNVRGELYLRIASADYGLLGEDFLTSKNIEEQSFSIDDFMPGDADGSLHFSFADWINPANTLSTIYIFDFDTFNFNVKDAPKSIPEPSTFVLLMLGLLGLSRASSFR